MLIKRLTHWCEKYDGIWVNEQTGSEQCEVLREAVGRIRAAAREHAQTGCAPASLFHAEELAERAEHTHREPQLHSSAAFYNHVQVLSRTVQAGCRNDLTLDNELLRNNMYGKKNLHWGEEDGFLH